MEVELKNDKYQVFLFTCSGNIPFNFFTHSWFVVNKLGKVSRWEILFRKSGRDNSWGHLHEDIFPPFTGIGIFPVFTKITWEAKLLGGVEGGENSVAKKMADFIENSPKSYLYCNMFLLWGPNCNTYTQWILDNFPEFKAKLPKNAVGKNYKIKKTN